MQQGLTHLLLALRRTYIYRGFSAYCLSINLFFFFHPSDRTLIQYQGTGSSLISVTDDVVDNNFMQLDGTDRNDAILSRSNFIAMVHPDPAFPFTTPIQNREAGDLKWVAAERVNVISGFKEVCMCVYVRNVCEYVRVSRNVISDFESVCSRVCV